MPRIFYSDTLTFPLPEGHRFPIGKYAALRRRLADGEVFPSADMAEAGMISPEDLLVAHDRDYVERFLDGSLDAKEIRRIGLPWSEPFTRRALASVGGTVQGGRGALETGFGGNLAGGTHHAYAGWGEGFCVFNDIAVAILLLLAERSVQRVAVVDLDVHQGNGTASILGDDPRVFLLDLYARKNYPFRKVPATLDLPLEDGTGDREYLALLGEALPRMFSFGPDIIFYQAGVDVLAEDSLGRLSLTHEGVRQRDRMVIEGAAEAGVPIVLTLGGGYSRPIDASVRAYAGTWEVAAATFPATEHAGR